MGASAGGPDSASAAARALALVDGPRADRGPLAIYQKRRAEGTYRDDLRQLVALELLQDVFTSFEQRYPKQKRPSGLTMVDTVATTQDRGDWWDTIFANTDAKITDVQPECEARPKGLYMYGGVGVGKTMLMDLLVESAPREFKLTRTHYHDFMLDVHAQLCKHKGESDPLVRVADGIRANTRLLALDEFFVTDVADAMILTRLFSRLWDRGLTLIATSNRAPSDLYTGGLQRQLFLPFIHRLPRHCVVHNMDSVTDHRRLAKSTVGCYFVRLVEGHTNDDRLEQTVAQLTQGASLVPREVPVAMGRALTAPRAAARTCIFTFEELCGQAVGAADYIALVKQFHTIAIKGVPVFNASNRSMAYRFVTLVDVAYEHKVKLLIAAEGYPLALFDRVVTYAESKEAKAAGQVVVVDDNLGFAKDRTVSRLIEMGTMEYAIMHAEVNAPELLLALQESQGKA